MKHYFNEFSDTLFICNELTSSIRLKDNMVNNIVSSITVLEAVNWSHFKKVILLVELKWYDYPYNGYHLLSELLENGIPFKYEGTIAMYSIDYSDIFASKIQTYRYIIDLIPFKTYSNSCSIQRLISTVYYRNYQKLMDEYHRLF